MKISGHATRSVFDRYDITSKRKLVDAARRLSEYLQSKNSTTLAKAVASEKLAHSERAVNLVN